MPLLTELDRMETTIGSETFYEWDFTGHTSGTGQTISPMPMQNLHAARVVIEGETGYGLIISSAARAR